MIEKREADREIRRERERERERESERTYNLRTTRHLFQILNNATPLCSMVCGARVEVTALP